MTRVSSGQDRYKPLSIRRDQLIFRFSFEIAEQYVEQSVLDKHAKKQKKA